MALQELAKEATRCALVAPLLHQNIDDFAILIDRAPQILQLATNLDQHFVQMPMIAKLAASTLELSSRSQGDWQIKSLPLQN